MFIKKYFKIICSFVFVTVMFLALDFVLNNKNMYGYILLYGALMLNTYIFSKIFKMRFEISIFASTICLMILATIMAMFGFLKYFIFVMIALEVIGIIYIIINRKRVATFEETKINSISLMIFSLMYVLFAVGGVDRYVHVWDEFSHWAYDAKVLQRFDALSNNVNVVSATRDIPPIVSIWHYFVGQFTGFGETHLYIGLSLLDLILLMPAFSCINKKNKIILPLFTIAILFGATVFGGIYSYGSLYGDYVLAMAYFAAFAIHFFYNEKGEKAKKFLVFLALATMILIKHTGIVNAFVFFVIAALVDYIKLNDGKLFGKDFWKKVWKVFKKYFLFGIAVVLVFVLWHLYTKYMNSITPMYYDCKVMPQDLESTLSLKLNKNVLLNVLTGALNSFDKKIIGNITVYQFYLILIVLGYIGNMIKTNGDFKKSTINMLPFIIGGILNFVCTLLSIFIAFSVYEARILASFERYLNVFNAAIILFGVLALVQSDIFENKKGKILAVTALLILMFNIGFGPMTFYVSDIKERLATRDTSYELLGKVKMINDYTPEDSQVYVIDQEDKDGIMSMWYARYYCFPRKINAYQQSITWKIRTEKNKEDLEDWGLTAEQLSIDLIKYHFDYLYLYTSDEEMFEKMEFMFEDYEKAKESKIFKVEDKDNNGKAELVVIK